MSFQSGLKILKIKKKQVLLLLLAVLASLGVLSYLARTNVYLSGDLAASQWVQSWRTPWIDRVMEGVTSLGQTGVAAIIVSSVVAPLILFRRVKEAVFLAAAAIAVSPMSWSMKALMQSPRPPASVVEVIDTHNGYGFPSGHAMLVVAFYGMLIILTAIHVRPIWLRVAAYTVFIGMILSTGLSRIYLGAHWLSDVYGGYLFGMVILLSLGLAYSRWLIGEEKEVDSLMTRESGQ